MKPLKSRRRNLARLSLFFLLCSLHFIIPNEAFAKAESSSESISSQEFLASPFAKAFKEQKYSKAIEALKELKKKYPEDPLILRYEALTLDRMGKTQEAIGAYQKLLAKDPGQVPVRIFLGRAYIRKRNYQAAAGEFRLVINDQQAEEYRNWAQAE